MRFKSSGSYQALVSVLLVKREYDSETCYPGLSSQLKPLYLGPLLSLLYEMNFICFTTGSKVKTNSQIIIRILIRNLKRVFIVAVFRTFCLNQLLLCFFCEVLAILEL